MLLSEDDMALLKAIKPFLSSKSQSMLDAAVTVLNVIGPMRVGQEVDVDALADLMNMVQSFAQAKQQRHQDKAYGKENVQILSLDGDNEKSVEAKHVEKLLNLIAEKKDQ